MPIGDPGWVQELVKVTKLADGTTEQENLGGVRFVPLIGEEGWSDELIRNGPNRAANRPLPSLP